MKISRLTVIATLYCFLIFHSIQVFPQDQGDQITIVISLDGFRWDYNQKTQTPALDLIAKEGVKATSFIPSFPSKTFPNHYTIATGLYPDHHGLVNNSFFDRKMGKSYAIGNREARFNPDFYGGEPIWITAQKQGIRTASFFWVGSDVVIQGKHPDYWKPYDESIPFIQRIDTIIYWLSLPRALRPRLIMAYYHEPDGVGHDYGPNDPRTLKMVHELDSLTGILYTRIRQLPDGNNINFIVVSDHGMGEISSERSIALRDYIPEKWPVKIEGGNPNYNIYAENEWIDSAYNALKKVKHLKVWKPAEIPAYLNYGTNPRVGDIIVVADSAWFVSLKKPKKVFTGGTHGYDIRNTDIHAIFYASGPAFKQNYLHPSFQNIHIYPLLAHLLGIIPAKTDGDLLQVIDLLKPRP
jgi:predicted AlkP superfamily pyrophosphatase or phosphodiesterase